MAESVEDKLPSHLQKHGLTDQKWLTMFQNMKIYDPENVEDKDRKFEVLRYAAASAMETISLRKALGIIFDPMSVVEGIDTVLQEAGLDAQHWSKVFSRQFGVITVQGVYHIPELFYPHLVHFARSLKEQKALQKLLKFEDDSVEGIDECYQRYIMSFQKRSSELLVIVELLERFKHEGRQFNDEEVQSVWRKSLEVLQVPKAFWFSGITFDSSLNFARTFHDFMKNVLMKQTPLGNLDLISQASKGLAFKGIIIKGGNEMHVNNCAISVSEDVLLQLPLYHQHLNHTHCKDKEEEEVIIMKMSNIKLDMSQRACKGKGGRSKYCSTIRHFVLPLASFMFQPAQLKMSNEAINKLNEIEMSSDSRNLCECFLKEFGSHVCLGPFHLGGSYRWRCFSCDVKQRDRGEAEKLQNIAIAHYMCGPPPPKHFQSVMEGTVMPCTQYGDELCRKTYIYIETKGGPETPMPLAFWKNHLVTDRKLWAVVDCGREYYPLWDIIKNNHHNDFHKPSLLAQKLKTTWENSYNSTKSNAFEIDAKNLDESVQNWVRKKKASDCINNLTFLRDKRNQVIKQSMGNPVWATSYLSCPHVQRYIKLMEDMCANLNSVECEEVKLILRQIIGKIDLDAVPDFTNRAFFVEWLFKTGGGPNEKYEYNDFMLHIECCFHSALEELPSRASDILELLSNPETTIKATAMVKNTIHNLRKYFQRTGRLYDEIYIVTIVFPFQYELDNNVLSLKGSSDIWSVNDLFRKHTSRYFDIKALNNATKLQAYLIQLSIEVSKEMGIRALCSKVTAHLARIFEMLGNVIDSNINDILEKLISCELSIESAQLSLEHIMSCANVHEIASYNHFVRSQAAKAPKPKNVAQDFDIMLSIFELKLSYPQKLTLSQALEVREGNVDVSNICTDRKFYPYLIIQNIMSFDHRCFVRLAPSAISAIQSRRINFKMARFVSSEKGKLAANINPLDGLITVLLCADNFLRQDLMCRLATCQNGIPLILPDPTTGKLTLTLWAMQTIIKQWKKGETVCEVPIITHTTPIISFLRFGTHQRSKSNLLNIIMNDSSHPTFFHYDCDGGSAKKIIAEGMVEIAWYLPSLTSKSFNDPVTFLNMHGDARNFPKQVKFLREISFMHFVLLDEEAMDEVGCEILQTLSNAPGGVVLLQNQKAVGKQFTMSPKYVVIKLNEKNVADTKAEIRKTIRDSIGKQWDDKSASKSPPGYKDAALKCGINVDEDKQECAEGISLAADFHTLIMGLEETNPKELLELQGVNLWHKIALMEKERYRRRGRHGVTVAKHTEKVMNDIRVLREQQHDCIFKMSENPLINLFITTLCNLSEKPVVRSYYLRWLKMLLDNLSREKLPPLHRKYHQKRAELQKAKGQAIESCKMELEQLNTQLINTSFGLEHLLREVGQVYEATAFFEINKYDHLPSIAASLLIDGYPLELMDGDAAHVPMKWVSAVLLKVKESLKNPKILVLSVLGIQSTGKSTLLNTVFGVNFSVSAGRCTRGAFMQLLPIHSSVTKVNNCSYLLLVDTEGLRAPELDATQTHDHDNQLATFVIGLANFTVINIYGEVSADMNDILQTVVHAFLRMKHVNDLHPGCHFVYQNVTGVMTVEKGRMGRGKIKDHLDKITNVAAKEEGLERIYTCFSDVIKFDDEKDVSYFPSLWFGNPPMAPVNPSYSRHARILRNELVGCGIPKKRRPIIKFSDFVNYLKHFWNAILSEDFVFSFKNSLEISAFSALDNQRSKWYWSFQKDMMNWEYDFETEICNYRGSNPAEAHKKAKHKLFTNAKKKYSNLIDEMNTFFEESTEKEILINWEAETGRLLNRLHIELTSRAEQYCERVWREKRVQERLNEIKSSHHLVISEKVREVVSHLDSEEPLKEPELKEKFEEQWKDWIKELEKLQVSQLQERHNIEEDMEKALDQHTEERHSKTLTTKMSPQDGGKSIECWGLELKLELKEEHIKDTRTRSLKQDMIDGGLSLGMSLGILNKREYWRPLAESETEYYLKEVHKYLQSRQNKDYKPTFVAELLQLLQKEISTFNSRSEAFQFTYEYYMDIFLTACGYALPKFKDMAVRHQNKHDPVKCLEAEKERYFQQFKDSYMRTAQEIIAARHCCELVEGAIEKRVIKNLCVTVVEKMEKDDENSFLFTKPALIKRVLGFIGGELKNRKFETCSNYLRHPMETLQDYVKKYTEQYCDDGYPCSRLTVYARELLKELMLFITNIVDETSQNHEETFIVLEWVEQFKKSASKLLIIEDTIAIRCVLTTKQSNHNIDVFTAELMKGLKIVEDNITQKLTLKAKDMEMWDQKPYDIIYDRVSGCRDACPFCREPCSNTNRDHDGDHTVKLHRPICLGGWRSRSTGKMTLETCTEEVANNRCFYVKPDSDEKHPFRTCEEIYPKWHIQEDLPGETALYWKYVVAHFKIELAKLYGMKEDSVPEHWLGFELSQAIEAL